MSSLMADFLAQARNFSPLEGAAVALAVGYLLLAIRQNIWCWLCAALSTAAYVWLCVDARLYMQAVLNVFYFGMAIYGWRAWLAGGRGSPELPVSTLPLGIHAIAIVGVVALALPTGFLMTQYSDAEFPYVDSLATYGAIWTTFLVARKVLENWWYWLVIDAASVVIYWLRELPLTALLFVLYLTLIPFGLIRWTRSWRAQTGQ